MRIVPHSVTLLHSTPDPERVIERAGRVCWKSEDRITDTSHVAFIRMLLDPSRKHESVLEHASAGFLIQTDRGVSHELVRHRIASFSQTSTRYVNYVDGKFGEEISVVKPVDLPSEGQEFIHWRDLCNDAEWAYTNMIERGAKPQVARSVLPTCLATEVVMTANFREWRHFLKLRLAPSAHPDMRVVAGLIRDQLIELAPTVFEEFRRDSYA